MKKKEGKSIIKFLQFQFRFSFFFIASKTKIITFDKMKA